MFLSILSSRRLQDMSSRRLQDVFKVKLLRWRRVEDVFKTCFEDILKTSSRPTNICWVWSWEIFVVGVSYSCKSANKLATMAYKEPLSTTIFFFSISSNCKIYHLQFIIYHLYRNFIKNRGEVIFWKNKVKS